MKEEVNRKSISDELEMLHRRFINPHDPQFNFDTFFTNEFEAHLFCELEADEEKHWYFGGKLRFIYFFRQFSQMVMPEAKPSENLKRILSYVRNSVTRIELLYYLEKFKDWIRWNESNHYEQFVGQGLSEAAIRHKLGVFYFLIDVYINNLKKTAGIEKVSPQDKVAPDPTVPLAVNLDEFRREEERISASGKFERNNQEKYDAIMGIVDFMNRNSPFTGLRIMSDHDFEMFRDYLWELVENGEVVPRRKIGRIGIQRTDIIYTMYLISNELYPNAKRNHRIYNFLVECFDGFEEDAESLKRGYQYCSLHKNFSRISKDYPTLNPEYCK